MIILLSDAKEKHAVTTLLNNNLLFNGLSVQSLHGFLQNNYTNKKIIFRDEEGSARRVEKN
jgi:hypothetical protein